VYPLQKDSLKLLNLSLASSSGNLPELELAQDAGSIPILSFTAAAIRWTQPR
jgi:hypothetical protein